MSRFGLFAIALSLLPAAALAQPHESFTPTPAFSYSVDVRAEMPESMTSLYVANATLQGLDAITTYQALGAGHIEANPVMKHGNRPLIIGTKIAATTASIYLAKRLWRQNRKAAVLSMIVTNAFMSFVVANNSAVLEGR